MEEEENVILIKEKSIQEQFDELNDKYIRLLAEFDNYKKRTTKEKLMSHGNGVEETILAILPVIDDFERAFEHNELAEGGQLIYKKLISTLKNLGLEKINIDEETNFNPDEHEAIAISFTGNKDKIIQVVLPGYKLNDKIIRYSKVVVG